MHQIHNEYFIEKEQLPVTVTLLSGEEFSGCLFVQPTWRQPSIEFDAPALLNLPEPYFPIQFANGKTRLVAKSHVVMMRGERSYEPGVELGDPADVSIRCTNGLMIHGCLRVTRITSSTRVLDYLNRPGEEFLLLHDQNSCALVNRRHIAVVHDLSDGAD